MVRGNFVQLCGGPALLWTLCAPTAHFLGLCASIFLLWCLGLWIEVALCARVPKGSEGVDVAVIGQWPQSLLPSSSALVCPPPQPGQSAETTGAPITCKAAVAWAAGAPLSA